MIMTLEEIQEKMKDRVLTVIAEKTGLHHNTLLNIKKGQKPHLRTLVKLTKYFKEN